MIVGIGIDLCPIPRMARALHGHDGRFEQRVFTEAERAYCQARPEPAQHFAARFAAKEALLKALAVPSGLSWHEIEVTTDAIAATAAIDATDAEVPATPTSTPASTGRPVLRLSGRAEEAAARLGVVGLHLSLTHTADTAAAVVVAEGEARPFRPKSDTIRP
jgi:holo-[acyl-carrier protein] synthase